MPLAPGYAILAADPAVAPLLPPIEIAAAALFPAEDLPRHLAEDCKDVDEFVAAAREGRLWVAVAPDERPVGFALVDLIDGTPHLDELDVHPDHGRRGVGRALVEAVLEWAAACRFRAVTLSTFGHLPWNAPFYARLGFRLLDESELTTGLRALRRREEDSGLDLAKRVVMRADLDR